MHLLMFTQTNWHILQLALCGGGGCGVLIIVETLHYHSLLHLL